MLSSDKVQATFVRRQTWDSCYSHMELLDCYGKKFNSNPKRDWGILERLVAEGFDAWEPVPGRPGVYKLDMSPRIEMGLPEVPEPVTVVFRSGVIEVKDWGMTLEAEFYTRREGEDPYVRVRAKEKKTLAKVVEIIIYSKEALGAEAAGADFEIISLNARVTEDPEPPTPLSMARNFLNLPGGSSAVYTAEEFARSIVYWSNRCLVKAPNEDFE